MSDAELVALLLQQPEEGCRILLEQYTGFVLAIVRRRIGGICSAEEIEELVSDVLFECYQQRHRIMLQKGTLRSLLATMTMHRCIDWYRHNSTQLQRSLPVEESHLHCIADNALAPDEQYLQKERCEQLYAMMQQLSETDRNIIMWKYYFGESAPEIAKRLSMRVGAVEMRISRAKKKLRKLMGGEEDAV